MKVIGPACAEAMSKVEQDGTRKGLKTMLAGVALSERSGLLLRNLSDEAITKVDLGRKTETAC
jgi:hypothetical protein